MKMINGVLNLMKINNFLLKYNFRSGYYLCII